MAETSSDEAHCKDLIGSRQCQSVEILDGGGALNCAAFEPGQEIGIFY